MAIPRVVHRAPQYTEGVVLDAGGNLYFSMTKAGTITVIAPDGGAARTWARVDGANGHAVDGDRHVVAGSAGAIVTLDDAGAPTGEALTVLAGKPLVYPNDVAIDPRRGGCWFTDSGYKQTPKEPPPDPKGRIGRIRPDGTAALAADGIAYSNGIALSPDGATLYCTESSARRLWAYPIRDDETLGARTLLAEIPTIPGANTVPDGITVPSDGTVYVAHYGAREILMYSPDGTLTARIDALLRTVSHVARASDGTLYASGGFEGEDGEGGIVAISA